MNRLLALFVSSLLLASCAGKTNTYELIPYPNELTPRSGTYAVAGAAFTCDERLDEASRAVVEEFAARLSEATQAGSAVSYVADPAAGEGFRFIVDEALEAERYQLDVAASGVTVRASSLPGFLYAVQTVKQLLPAAFFGGEADAATAWTLPCVAIDDAPRFAYRGLMLDVARHFFSKEEVEKIIDLMAFHKLNRLHWHLTDDQGWRIEIKRYPRLTEFGSIRKGTVVKKNWDQYDGVPYGGYYTQDEIREVVAYAAARGIDVIPELDMPGHLMGAQQGYPWITCTGESSWGESFSSPLCPGKDSALMFAKNVYSEVFSLFPYEYVHLGADEVEKTNWKACPDCQARIGKYGLKDENELQAWFVHDMERHFNANGKKLIGWDEIVDGGLSPTATITWWRDWAPKAVVTATAQGNKVILCPDFLLYLDFAEQARDLKRIYDTEPTTYRADWNLTPQQKANIRGVQANTWCERIPSVRRMQYQILPRLLAHSEIAWVQPEAKDWEDFQRRFVAQADYFDRRGINYRVPDLTGFNDINVFVDTAVVEAKCILPNIRVRYTTDGSFPNAESPLYTGPITITESTKFIFRPFRPDGTAGAMQTAEYRKEDYSPAQALPEKKMEDGIRMVYREFKGRKCAEIGEAKVVRNYTLDSVAVPSGLEGWLGLVYEGYVEVPADGVYTFALTSNDGSMLYVDDERLIDNDGPHGDTRLTAQRALAGGWHKIRVEYFDMNNGGMLSLQWASPNETALRTLTGFKHW